MIDTNIVYSYLKKNSSKSFNEIWKSINKDIKNNNNLDNDSLKSDLFLSMLKDNRFFFNVKKNLWNLKEDYSYEELLKNKEYSYSNNAYFGIIEPERTNETDYNDKKEIDLETTSEDTSSLTLEEYDENLNSEKFDDEEDE